MSANTPQDAEPKGLDGGRNSEQRDPETIAREIAEDDAGTADNKYASWQDSHSCSPHFYGCCGGGKEIDREVLAQLIAAAIRTEREARQKAETELEGLQCFLEDKTVRTLEAERRAEVLLKALREIEIHCPCGARPESLDTHPHVIGCPVARALAPQDDETGTKP